MFILSGDDVPPVLGPYLAPYIPPGVTWTNLLENPNYQLAYKYFLLNGGLFLTALLWGLAFIGLLFRCYPAQTNSSTTSTKVSFATLVFLSCATGLALIIAELFLLSVFHFLDVMPVRIAYGFTCLFALISIFICRKQLSSACTFLDNIWTLLAGLFFVFLLLVYQFSISNSPTIADATAFHIPYADFFLKHHGLAVFEHMIYPYHVFNINLLFSLALMLDHQISYVQSVSGLFAAICMLGLYAFCRESGQRLFIALLLPFIFCMDYSISSLAITGNVDTGGMFFVFACAFALWLWQKTSSIAYLIVSAISLGLAIGSKYILLIFPLPVALCLIYFGRPNIWRYFLIYVIWAACWGLWWYIRNIIYTGNPVHPFAQNIFGYYLWTAQDLAQQMVPILNDRIPRSIKGILLSPWYAYNSEVLTYQGSFPFIVMLFISTACAKWIGKGMNLLLVFAWCYLISWIWGSQDPRHLMPVYPIILVHFGMVTSHFYNIVTTFLLPSAIRKYVINTIGILAVTGALVYGGLYVRKHFVYVYFMNLAPSAEQKQMMLGNSLLELASHINDVFGETDIIYEMGVRELHSFINANVVGNPFGPHGYWQIIDAASYGNRAGISPEKLERVLKEKYNAKGLVIASGLPYFAEEFNQHLHLEYQNDTGAIYTWKDKIETPVTKP